MSVPAINIRSASRAEGPLLDVRDLTVRYRLSPDDRVEALRQISFRVERRESVGVLGESGSGKTTLALAMLGLLPRCAEVSSGAVCFRGRDLTTLGEASLRKLRGAEIATVPQEPSLALNPVICVGQQITDVVRAHSSLDRRQARAAAEDLIYQVGLLPVDRIYSAYPHQLSGGQCQRVVIAQALVCQPSLLIADEPTSSLDEITQSQILTLLQSLQREHGFALMLITHDPRVIEQMVTRIIVLRDGRIVDQGSTWQMFASPACDYSRSLLSSIGNN